jgi:Leucine-rich repeat (LRR) protein
MTTKTARTVFSIAALSLVCSLSAVVVGCSEADTASTLPQQQNEAVKTLRAANAKVAIRDGNVTYIDFYQVTGVPGLLIHLKSFPHLQTINFSGTDVTDDSLAHLDGLANLKELALNYTKISDKGVAHLAGLTTLEAVNLNKVDVTDAGLEHLKHMHELVLLNLNETQIGDAGIKHLGECTKLKNLSAYGTNVTAMGAEEFRKTHPDAEISFSQGGTKGGAEFDNKTSTPASN